MGNAVLVIDGDEMRRRAMVRVLVDRGVPFVEGADTFHAMAVLGRADFGVAIVAEETRHLAMRGFMLLARKRHPDIRLLVMLRDGTDQQQLRNALGVQVECIHPDAPVEAVTSYAVHALGKATPFDIPTTTVVTEAVHDAVREDLSGDPQTAALAIADTTPAAPPPGTLLEGTLDVEPGVALLMAVFGQELTGRLFVHDGPARGTVYCLRGEPVWADDPEGDAGLFPRLIASGKIPADLPRPAVAEGMLLGVLAQMGVLTGEAVHHFMRDMVRERVLLLCQTREGGYRFVEDRTFLDATPLLKVNPLGMMLEAMRRTMTPDRLLAEGFELARNYIISTPGLTNLLPRLTPFTRGRDIAGLLDGHTTVEAFCERSGLDTMMGTLVLLTLRDARMLLLSPVPQMSLNSSIRLKNSLPPSPFDDVVVPDSDLVVAPAPTDGAMAAARDAILALYARLKPVNHPAAVLGVPPHAASADVEAAYQRRLAELDGQQVPDGADRVLLEARLEELRRKLAGARQTLLMQDMDVSTSDPRNPF